MIQVKSFVFSPFSENTYVLFDETKACIVIDPGCMQGHEEEELQQFISQNELKVEKVVNTHCHIDHIYGNKFVKDTYKVPLYIPEGEEGVLSWGHQSAEMWGIPGYESAVPDTLLPNEGTLTFGDSTLEILFVPGHSPGHLAFYAKDQGFVISGDVLFNGSIGRTDLPGGDFATLEESIKTVMYALPEETKVYSGHGEPTTIAQEKVSNPYVRA